MTVNALLSGGAGRSSKLSWQLAAGANNHHRRRADLFSGCPTGGEVTLLAPSLPEPAERWPRSDRTSTVAP